jgi:hypothetical protein
MLSVIVPYYLDTEAKRADLFGLVRHAAQQTTEFELILVNDGGAELTGSEEQEMRQQLGDLVAFVTLEPRSIAFRAGLARNLGASLARGDRLLFLDADCWPWPGLFEIHAGHQDRLVFGQRRGISRQRLERYTRLDTQEGIHDVRFRLYRELAIQLYSSLTFATGCWQACWSCNLSCPRDKFCELGGFWEALEGYGSEDQELAWRWLRLGWPLWVDFTAGVWHIDHPQRATGGEALQRRRQVLRESARQPLCRPSRFLTPRQGGSCDPENAVTENAFLAPR